MGGTGARFLYNRAKRKKKRKKRSLRKGESKKGGGRGGAGNNGNNKRKPAVCKAQQPARRDNKGEERVSWPTQKRGRSEREGWQKGWNRLEPRQKFVNLFGEKWFSIQRKAIE